MWEHRLIETMVGLLRGEIDRIAVSRSVNAMLIDQAVGFFHTYADRMHHGKEEEILFRDLKRKALSPGLRKIMGDLESEHVQGRGLVSQLVEARELHAEGDTGALALIAARIEKLAAFCPAHIEKEDKLFFFPCLEYFSVSEQQRMLDEFCEFDRGMIHEEYGSRVDGFLGRKVPRPPRPG
jgi:hemerythrin-like domain-containing protein